MDAVGIVKTWGTLSLGVVTLVSSSTGINGSFHSSGMHVLSPHGTSSSTYSAQECRPPDKQKPPSLHNIEPVDQYEGRYVLTVVAVEGVDRETAITGNLALWRPEERYRKFVQPHVRFPLHGISDIQLDSLGNLTLAYSPATLDPEQPGVQVVYDTEAHTLVLKFGAADRVDAVRVDQGVFFEVFSIDQHGFVGRWFDGGNIAPRLAGYFCARRIGGLP